MSIRAVPVGSGGIDTGEMDPQSSTQPDRSARRATGDRRTVAVAGIALSLLTLATCLLLGTVGWFVVGFGTMTDCTNNYSCSGSGCGPCATTGFWINAGAAVQLALAALAGVLLLLCVRAKRWSALLFLSAALLLASVVTIVGSTVVAQTSYCRPGTAGYASSYCSVEP